MESHALHRFTLLGHAQRMAVFRLLMRRHPDTVPAGEIATALGLKASTLSVYLRALSGAGLIGAERRGTSLRYRVRMETVRAMTDFLFLDCCRGRADLLPRIPSPRQKGHTAMPDRKFNVLFLCTGNSARSIFAEAILRAEAGARFNAFSAGTSPAPAPNARAVEMLRAKGHDTAPLSSKSLNLFQGPGAAHLDFVFTVCDRAANEECPSWPGQPVTGHWGVPDPVSATGTDAQKRLAFQQAYGLLRNRILGFTALPLETLDRLAQQTAVDALASKEETA